MKDFLPNQGPARRLSQHLAPLWARVPRRVWWGALFILLATVLAYAPVYSAGFIWDDDDYVVNNPFLHDWQGLWAMWVDPHVTPQYYPLVFTSFWLEYHCWGLSPCGYHVVNVLLQALAALLLWRVLVRLHVPGAWLAGALFAVHPVEVESVAWITERKNVLSTVLYLLAVLAYFRFVRIEDLASPVKRRAAPYVVALVLFVAALWSKTVTCSLPAALLLVLWWKKGRLERRDILPLLPFFAVGMLLGLNTAWLEKTRVGANGGEWALSLADRCLVAGRALWFYAAHLVFPARLAFIYPRWTIDAGVWWQWLFPLAVVAVLAALWSARERVGRGPLVAVLFFVGTMAPSIGFFNVYSMRFSFVADHFQYLASMGLIALAAARLCLYPRLVTGALLFLFGVLTFHQCFIYQNLETLWHDTLRKNPESWSAHVNLGDFLEHQGRFPEAEAEYRTALQLNPRVADAHFDYGNLLAATGRLKEALPEFQESLRLNPDRAETHNNLGAVLFQLGRTPEAVVQFRAAVAAAPSIARYHYNLGSALEEVHDRPGAVAEFRRAWQIEPGSDLVKRRLQALGATVD